jgi:electron transfer flavoprotein beta subunit
LKILVAIKPVPNPDEKVKIKGDGGGIVLDGIKMVVNPFCEIAVEEALRIKEKQGGEVVVATVGSKESEQQVRTALAMGADRAVLVEAGPGLDSLAVAKVLAKVVAYEKADLALVGKQSVDDDNNQVGQILAAVLGWPQVTFASKMDFSADGGKVNVTREVDGGLETIEVALPAVITAGPSPERAAVRVAAGDHEGEEKRGEGRRRCLPGRRHVAEGEGALLRCAEAAAGRRTCRSWWRS